MNRLALLLMLALIGSLATEVRAAVELSAFLAVSGQPKFVITDLEENAKSGWLGLGQSFHGYDLVAYDARREVLTVRKNQRTYELSVIGSHVASGTPPPETTLPPDVVAAGITPADLIVRDSGPMRITLTVGSQEQPMRRRFINVQFDSGTDRAGVQFQTDGPAALSRAFVPEAVRDFVSDQDIALINAHLSAVRAKWLPQRGG